MDNFKVSVIVPVYNCCEYIGSTLDAIINQDFEDFEIIVIDDGSTDNSLEIIKEKLSTSTRHYEIIHQENAGVSCARNRGIEIARGDYLVFVDADDFITKNHLSQLYNGKTDFSLTQFVKKDGEHLSKPHHFTEKLISCDDFIRMELNMEIPFHFCQLMYKTSIVNENNIRFTPNVVYGEDTEFALKTFIFGENISLGNEITYYYVQHDESAIRTSEFKRFEVVNIFENLAQYYRSHGKDELANLIVTSRIPKAIFGNMNYFFYNDYNFEDVIEKMHQLDLFEKLSKFEGDSKSKFKIKLFLLNPNIYYKVWKKIKNSID
ncbi:glycosyltransferase family 2 protein [uncultured Methanobrevibacter sp.]|uniref:glycosyltransferase family 2 protein n=1 Tax=uncultured Methanobrevibacter sp. TaxID=253161 RepID=UPI0025E5F697|nr:glycosyltransferase family 2 protein [uncultured Methanobrevibacter sp.]